MLKIKLLSIVMMTTLAGCCCNPTTPAKPDPYECFNRSMYNLNRTLDKGSMRLVAYGYYSYTPKEFQSCVHNFFSNATQPITIINDCLQAKMGYAAHDTSRFVINTTFGLAGLFDVAAWIGLDEHKEDFGQTLFTWGYRDSAYLMLPILGPSTVRDTIGLIVDIFIFDPFSYVDDRTLRYSLYALYRIDTRANLLAGEKLLETVGIDEYAFVKDVYYQRRLADFYDGQVPECIASTDQDPFAEPGFEESSESETISDPQALPGPIVDPEFPAPNPVQRINPLNFNPPAKSPSYYFQSITE